MWDVVLCQPQIPPNTRNIIRLCGNSGCHLHLIRPLGFILSDTQLQRAGLDYHHLSHLSVHDSFNEFLSRRQPKRLLAIETGSDQYYTDVNYQIGDAFIFGSETSGLNKSTLKHIDQQHVLSIPMRAGNRSLNLSNAVAIVVYEAWRQQGFKYD